MKKLRAAMYILGLGMAGFVLGFSSNAAASAFQWFEQNAVNAGDWGAGGAAIAADASTAFFNPAGLTRLKNPQIVAGVDVIDTDIPVRGTTSTIAQTAYGPLNYTASGKTNGGITGYIPFFHVAQPLNDSMAFGFSVASPFGLMTEYDSDSFVNATATKTQLKTLDFSPNLAYQVNKDLSAGLGIDIQRADVEFDSVGIVDYSALAGIPYALTASSINTASGWGYGWHVGLLYNLSSATRVGLSYRSQVSYELQGSSTFSGSLADGQVVSNHLKADLMLPPSATLSVFHDLNQSWALLGSITYTKWDVVRTIGLDNIATIDTDVQPIIINTAKPANFRNTWRFALGTNYKANDKWLFRTGIGYDQTPTNNHDRDIRLPEGDGYGFSLGAHYQATKMVGIDFGWTHVFMKPVSVSSTAVAGILSSTVNGRIHPSADIFGGQITWDIS